MALPIRRVSQQSLVQLNSVIPGTGRTVAETLGFRPVVDGLQSSETLEQLGAPVSAFQAPRDLSADERVFGKPPTLEDKPLPPLFGGTFELPSEPARAPRGRGGAFVSDPITLGSQTAFRPGTPQANLARVLFSDVGLDTAGADGTGSPASAVSVLPSPGPVTFGQFQGGAATPGTGIAFSTLSGADRLTAPGLPAPLSVPAFAAPRGLFAGGPDRPGAGAGRRRLAGQLIRRVRDPEPQGALVRTRPLSSLQPQRRASVDPVKKRLLNTLVR